MDGATPANALKPDWNELAKGEPRTDWTLDEVQAIYQAPFADLMHNAQIVHRTHFEPNQVQISTLLSHHVRHPF